MKILTLLPITIILAFAIVSCKDEGVKKSDTAIIDDSVKKLDKDAFVQGYQKSGVVLIDLRFPQEYEQGHLEGAININFFDPDFKHKLLELDKSKTYYLYDKSDQSSFRAMKFMEDNGFKQTYILKGGYRDWNKSKEEIEAEEKARAKELKEREPDTIVIQK